VLAERCGLQPELPRQRQSHHRSSEGSWGIQAITADAWATCACVALTVKAVSVTMRLCRQNCKNAARWRVLVPELYNG